MKDVTVSELLPRFLFPLHSALESAARSHLLIFRRVASSPSFPSVLLLLLTWVIFSVWWQCHHFLVPSREWSHWTPLTLRTSLNSSEGHTGPSPCGPRTCPSCHIRLCVLSEHLELFLSWLFFCEAWPPSPFTWRTPCMFLQPLAQMVPSCEEGFLDCLRQVVSLVMLYAHYLCGYCGEGISFPWLFKILGWIWKLNWQRD